MVAILKDEGFHLNKSLPPPEIRSIPLFRH